MITVYGKVYSHCNTEKKKKEIRLNNESIFKRGIMTTEVKLYEIQNNNNAVNICSKIMRGDSLLNTHVISLQTKN